MTTSNKTIDEPIVSSDIIRQRLILKTVADYTGIPTESIISRNRKEGVIYARQLSVYFLSMFTKYNTVKLGEIVGGRDHSTILHTLGVMKDRLATEPDTCEDIAKIKGILKSIL